MKRRLSIAAALGTLLVVAFTALLVVTPALADDYKYTVRVFPGNRGSLAEDPVVREFPKGTDVNLYEIAPVTVSDAKYVQTGYRQSGADKVWANGVINKISEDMDFVVAYGVKANTVPYTIRFVEYETGKELAESKTFYGTVGEKPVAAYEYIEGYRPRYLSITGTLKADEDNVWTFEYIPLAEGETFVTTTTNTTTSYVDTPVGGGTTTTTTTGGQTGGATTTGTTEGGAATTTEGQNATSASTQNPTEPTAPQTQEILDLDTPLAGPDANKATGIAEKGANILTNPVGIAGVAIALVAGLGLLLYLANRKKKEKDQQNEEEA